MDKPGWIIRVKPDGKLVVEGQNFQGSQCADDIIYQILQKIASIESEEKHASFNDDSPVDNVYYVEN